jgi:hypothetical protein
MKKSVLKVIAQVLMTLVAVFVGGGAALLAAAPVADALQGSGKTVANENGQTRSNVEPNADPEFYLADIDQEIAKIRPQSTAIDTLTRQIAKRRGVKAMEVGVYEIGSRVLKTEMSTSLSEQSSGTTVVLDVKDPKVFTYADQILVEGVKGYEEDGTTRSDAGLVLLVTGTEEATGKPIVVAVNGKKDDTGTNAWVPEIASGTVLVRMGKACAESDAQVPAFALVPTRRTNFCQNYMFQIKQSIIDRMSDKEVPFSFTDLEREAIFDMKRGQELTRLFSVKRVVTHPTKNEQMYSTQGLWWQAKKDYELATDTNEAVTAATMVDFMKSLNTGMGAGSKKKVLVAGSKVISAITKMELDKLQVLKQDTEKMWNIEFTGFSAFSGKLLAVHSELFDEVGMEEKGLVIDPDELTLATFMPFSRRELELQKSGQSNSEAVVFQQIDCVYIANPYTACRVSLKKNS